MSRVISNFKIKNLSLKHADRAIETTRDAFFLYVQLAGAMIGSNDDAVIKKKRRFFYYHQQ